MPHELRSVPPELWRVTQKDNSPPSFNMPKAKKASSTPSGRTAAWREWRAAGGRRASPQGDQKLRRTVSAYSRGRPGWALAYCVTSLLM